MLVRPARSHLLVVSFLVGASSPTAIPGAAGQRVAPVLTADAEGGRATAPQAGPSLPRDNSLCLVCHVDLQSERIAAKHLAAGIPCAQCHGASMDHMHDEMLMTKPDILFGRIEVEPFCKTCHEEHEDPAAVERFRDEWRGRDRPNGRVVTDASICTDCHGLHNIVKEMGTSRAKEEEWIPLFNGTDLSGFQATGEATWRVEKGAIVGEQGRGGAGGDLLSKTEYADFLLSVTYRVAWPANSGVWFRYQSPRVTYQADIVESTEPPCWSGTLHSPGKMFLAMNKNGDLVDREGWNTLSIRADGGHIQVWLNGHQVADVHDAASRRGRIGFEVNGARDVAGMRITIREALLQPLRGTPGGARQANAGPGGPPGGEGGSPPRAEPSSR